MNFDFTDQLLNRAEVAALEGDRERHQSELRFLERLFAEIGDPGFAVGLSPANLFRVAMQGRCQGSLRVVALPWEKPIEALQLGDWMLRAVPAIGDVGHAAVLACSDLMTTRSLFEEGIIAEGTQRGFYGVVIEGGAFPHTRMSPFARRFLDAHGRVPANTIVLRPQPKMVETSIQSRTSNRPSSLQIKPANVSEPYLDLGGEAAEAMLPDPVRKWLELLGGGYLARPGNKVTTLVDGNETYDAMYQALITARSKGDYIYLLGWSCDSTVGLLGNADGTRRSGTSLEAVLRKVSPDVQIRAMLWRQIWRKKQTPYYVENEATVKMVNSLPNGAAISDKYTPLRRNSHHQKILIVNGSDGVIAFCGGIDIYADRVLPVSNVLRATSSGGPNGSPLHDVHCRIQGPACEDLLEVFDQRWCSHPDTKVIDRAWKKGPLIWRQTSAFHPKGAAYVRVTRTFNCVLQDRLSIGAGDDEMALDEDPSDPEALRRLSKRACKKERSIADVLFTSIEHAKKFIYVEEQYMIDLKVAEALKKAINNGTHIIFLIPHSTITTVPWIAKRRKAFIEAVSSVAGENDKDGRRGSFRVFYLIEPKTNKLGHHCYVHAKMWIFDDEMAIIGSANCNRRGLSSDSEANVCVFDAPYKGDSIAKALRKRLWKEHLGLENSDGLDDPGKSADLWRQKSSTSRVREYDPAKAKEPPGGGDPEAADYGGLVDPDLDGLPTCGPEDCPGCSASFLIA